MYLLVSCVVFLVVFCVASFDVPCVKSCHMSSGIMCGVLRDIIGGVLCDNMYVANEDIMCDGVPFQVMFGIMFYNICALV